jgi:hypothetical protein
MFRLRARYLRCAHESFGGAHCRSNGGTAGVGATSRGSAGPSVASVSNGPGGNPDPVSNQPKHIFFKY